MTADPQAELARLRAFANEMAERYAAQSYALSIAAERQGEQARRIAELEAEVTKLKAGQEIFSDSRNFA
jgi:hypothetical protein